MTNEQRTKLLDLAAAARPQPTFPDNRERDGDDDWGSERQIDAENAFHQYCAELGLDTDDLPDKATGDELIDEMLRRTLGPGFIVSP
jgi:hypothetical protein